jgi:hypothetical protein
MSAHKCNSRKQYIFKEVYDKKFCCSNCTIWAPHLFIRVENFSEQSTCFICSASLLTTSNVLKLYTVTDFDIAKKIGKHRAVACKSCRKQISDSYTLDNSMSVPSSQYSKDFLCSYAKTSLSNVIGSVAVVSICLKESKMISKSSPSIKRCAEHGKDDSDFVIDESRIRKRTRVGTKCKYNVSSI